MIKITDFNLFLEDIVNNVSGVKKHYISVTEKQAVHKIKDIDNDVVVLMAVMPSGIAKSNSNRDNYEDTNSSFLFILEKTNFDEVTDESEIEQYNKLQQFTEEIKQYLIDKSEDCQYLQNLDIGSLGMDPEYDTFGGFNGWMLTLTFDEK